MMMMMRRFVKRVLNSPQRRCQSIKQVALEMSGERQRRERLIAVRRAAGKWTRTHGQLCVAKFLYGHLPSFRASPPFERYQVILLGDKGDIRHLGDIRRHSYALVNYEV